MVIKKLSANELGILTKLYCYNDVVAMLSENTDLINRGVMDIFCIFDGSEPFGELRVRYCSDDKMYADNGVRAYLYAFRINKEYRGKGYGQLLMHHVIDSLKLSGYGEFTIGVSDKNFKARHIYEKFGFNTVLAKRIESYQGNEYAYTLLLKAKKIL